MKSYLLSNRNSTSLVYRILFFVFIWLSSSVTYGYNQISHEKIKSDLIGQIIYEPSSNGYFPKSWRWELEPGEILDIQILAQETDYYHQYITLLVALNRGSIRINAEMEITYTTSGVLKSSIVKSISIPKQRDYSQYVSLKIDDTFLPMLVLYNNCNTTLFVGGEYQLTSGESYKFGCIVEPLSSETIVMGSIDTYSIHFAYLK